MKNIAYILARVVAGKSPGVLESVKDVDIVKESYLIYGLYDLLLRVEMDTPEQLDNFLYGKLRKLDGVLDTVTCLCASCDRE